MPELMIINPYGRSQDSFVRPASLIAGLKRYGSDASPFCPLGQTCLLAIQGKNGISRLISGLLLLCGPPKIHGPFIGATLNAFAARIMPIVIDAINRMRLGRSQPNNTAKYLKQKKSLANSDSSTAIPRVSAMGGIEAAFFNALEGFVLNATALTVGFVGWYLLGIQTAARPSTSRSKISSCNGQVFTTRALTDPYSVSMFVVPTEGHNRKSCEFVSDFDSLRTTWHVLCLLKLENLLARLGRLFTQSFRAAFILA